MKPANVQRAEPTDEPPKRERSSEIGDPPESLDRITAIDSMTPEGRAIFVRMMAKIALARVLDDLDAEDQLQGYAAETPSVTPSKRRAG